MATVDEDAQLAREALREVLRSKKAGTRVKTSAALTLARMTGVIGGSDGDVTELQEPDPFIDMDFAGWVGRAPEADLSLVIDQVPWSPPQRPRPNSAEAKQLLEWEAAARERSR